LLKLKHQTYKLLIQGLTDVKFHLFKIATFKFSPSFTTKPFSSMTINFCYFWQLIFVFLFFCRSANAQENTFTYTGKLLDAVTLRPITGAHILGPQQQAVSDSAGIFHIPVTPHTKLKITHVGYESTSLEVVPTKGLLQTITIFPITIELAAITVCPLPDEAEFKQLILQAEVPISWQEANLKQNMGFIQRLKHLAYFYDMNSYDMFLANTKDGGTVSFLSNNPSLGILSLIRRLRQDKTVPGRAPQPQHVPSLWKAYKRKEGEYKWLFE